MDELRELLVQARNSSTRPELGIAPLDEFTIDCGSVAIRGKRIGICDPGQVPGGISVPCVPGTYDIEAHCYLYGSDARVAWVRAKLRKSSPSLGPTIGEFGVDLAMACIFDADSLDKLVEAKPNDYAEWLEDSVVFCDWQPAGVLRCTLANVDIPYFEVGFGDGQYPVQSLVEGGRAVGIVATFLDEKAAYPFAATPDDQAAGSPDFVAATIGGTLGEKICSTYRDWLPDPQCVLAFDFEFSFPSRDGEEAIIADLQNAGIEPTKTLLQATLAALGSEDMDLGTGDDGGEWRYTARGVFTLDVGALNALGARLDEIAERYGGRFVHWSPAMSTRNGALADTAQLNAADLCNAGLHGEAIPLLREIVSLPVPIGKQSWRILGMALAKTKQHEEAFTALERALKVDSSDHDSRVNLVSVWRTPSLRRHGTCG